MGPGCGWMSPDQTLLLPTSHPRAPIWPESAHQAPPVTHSGRARPWVSAQWPCSLGGEELTGRSLSQEEALDPTGHAGRAPEPASFCTFYLTCFPRPLLPRLQGAQLAPTAVESATDHQEGTFHTVPSPKHTHNPERAGALRAAGGALCGLGEERSPLPSQRSPERVPGQRPGAGQLRPGGRVIRSQRESPACALEDSLGAGEPRSPLGAGCVAPYTLHCLPRAFHSPPGVQGGACMPFTPVRRPLPHNLQQGSSWATFWDPAQSRSWPSPRANLSPAGPVSPPGERGRGPGTPRPSHSTWLEDPVMQTPGQFHFLICLCSQKGGLEGSQPHPPPTLALPTSARPVSPVPRVGVA